MINKPINNEKQSDFYKEGYKASKSVDRSANPYRPRTYKFSEWDRGWFNAMNNIGRRFVYTSKLLS